MSQQDLSSTICSACSHLFKLNDWPATEHEERVVPHHSSKDELELAAHDGCRLCGMIMEAEEYHDRRADPTWETKLAEPGTLYVTRRAGKLLLSFLGIDTDDLPVGRCPWVEIDVLEPDGR